MLRNSEFNYLRNDAGECVLIPGLSPRDPDPKGQCRADDAWYELTPYRKIPYSSCEGGKRLDRGAKHTCPGVGGHSAFFWLMMLFIPVCFAGLAGYYYLRKGGYGRGYVPMLTNVFMRVHGPHSIGRSDYQAETADHAIRAHRASWTPSRVCHTSLSASRGSRMSGSQKSSMRLLFGCRDGEVTAICQSMKTRRFYGSRTRSRDVAFQVIGEGKWDVGCCRTPSSVVY